MFTDSNLSQNLKDGRTDRAGIHFPSLELEPSSGPFPSQNPTEDSLATTMNLVNGK